ncbi:MAG: protein kinase [Spirochaetales bacterium]|nr:protein kinase [Spirochaetales bacterium]
MASDINLQGYEIIEKLGEGGMAEVHLARQKSLDRNVVIKKLMAAKADIERIRKEGLILSKLNHPNIVTVHDLVEENGVFYLIEEFLEGVTLREYLDECIEENKPITLETFAKLAGQMIDGVECAHSKGIIHRDLKPENIIILGDGRVKICDFGISAFDTQQVASTYKIAGTLEYMPPELFDDNPQITVLGDYYSLGCIFYEMISLKKPFGFIDTTGLGTVIRRKTSSNIDFNIEIDDEYKIIWKDIENLVGFIQSDREKGLRKFTLHIKDKLFDKEDSKVSKTKTVISKNMNLFLSKKKNNEVDKKHPADKITNNTYRFAALNTYGILIFPLLGFSAVLIWLLFIDFIIPTNSVLPVIFLGVFGILFLIGIFIDIVLGMIFLQKKEKHGWLMLIIPIVNAVLVVSLFPIYPEGPLLSGVIVVITFAFYFYLWYYFSKKINILKKISKATLLFLLITVIGTGICYGAYKFHLFRAS